MAANSSRIHAHSPFTSSCRGPHPCVWSAACSDRSYTCTVTFARFSFELDSPPGICLTLFGLTTMLVRDGASCKGQMHGQYSISAACARVKLHLPASDLLIAFWQSARVLLMHALRCLMGDLSSSDDRLLCVADPRRQQHMAISACRRNRLLLQRLPNFADMVDIFCMRATCEATAAWQSHLVSVTSSRVIHFLPKMLSVCALDADDQQGRHGQRLRSTAGGCSALNWLPAACSHNKPTLYAMLTDQRYFEV